MQILSLKLFLVQKLNMDLYLEPWHGGVMVKFEWLGGDVRVSQKLLAVKGVTLFTVRCHCQMSLPKGDSCHCQSGTVHTVRCRNVTASLPDVIAEKWQFHCQMSLLKCDSFTARCHCKSVTVFTARCHCQSAAVFTVRYNCQSVILFLINHAWASKSKTVLPVGSELSLCLAW